MACGGSPAGKTPGKRSLDVAVSRDGGKSWEYRLVYPDGQSQVVLSVPRYDFNWQTYYVFTTPLAAPKGSRLEATAHYDNSVNNKWNPDPKIDVRWGEQTWQEMQYSGITYYVDQPAGPESAAVR